MITQMSVKAKVFLGIVVLAAAGLVAAERTLTVAETRGTVELAPQAGLPASRPVDAAAAPRECDRLRGEAVRRVND